MSGKTTEADAAVQQSEEGYSFSAMVSLVLLLPVVACYPLYYLTRDDDGKERLEDEFGISPVSLAPGVNSADTLFPALGYGVALVALLAGLFFLTPLSAFGFVITIVLAVVGLSLTAYLGFHAGMKRELAQRFALAVGIAVGLSSVVVVGLVWSSMTPLSALLDDPRLFLDVGSVPFVSVLLGAVSGNAFVVKRNELHQRSKQQGESDGGEIHVVTDSYQGDSVSDSKGQKLLERLANQKWTAPDDLDSAGKIQKTRKIEPLRDIVRALWVEEERYEHTIAKSKFREKKREFRTDPNNRENVAPSGFDSDTYNYIFEDSITERRCSECGGHGALSCGDCGGHGEVQCGNCGGSGRTRCSNCNGDMEIVKRETCKTCGGDGTNQRGYTCGTCGGDGGHETRARCPKCRGQGEVDCGNCRSGKVRCRSCDGSGEVGCGNCGTTGKIMEFNSLTRTYSPDKDVSYRNKSVPTRLLTDAAGVRIEKDRDENPTQDGLYRREDETRKIPVTVATYEYLGDKWEVFDVEDALKVVDFPRDYAKQMRLIQAVTALLVPAYLFVVVVGF